MPEVQLRVAAQTDVGRARTINEDAYVIADLAAEPAPSPSPVLDVGAHGALLAVSDGMGGHQAGDVASGLVLASLRAALQHPTSSPVHERLEDAVHGANRAVLSAAQTAERRGMGATLTAVLVSGRDAYIAEVGDSRAYLLRGARLARLTRDQSLVQLLLEHELISADDAASSPARSAILQAMGHAPQVRAELSRLRLRRGDRLLICSDGISNALSDDELREILIDSGPSEACGVMIAIANARGGEDNQTAIVADVLGDGLDPAGAGESLAATFELLRPYQATVNGRAVTNADLDQLAASFTRRARRRPVAEAPTPPVDARDARARRLTRPGRARGLAQGTEPGIATAADERVRVLVVDDDPAFLEAVRRGLSHVQVTAAATPLEAIWLLEHSTFRAVLCDLRLGDQDGRHVLQVIKDRCPDAARILVTDAGGELDGLVPAAAHVVVQKSSDLGELGDVVGTLTRDQGRR